MDRRVLLRKTDLINVALGVKKKSFSNVIIESFYTSIRCATRFKPEPIIIQLLYIKPKSSNQKGKKLKNYLLSTFLPRPATAM